jgi:putative addiction module component (TIGR02574 family)
VFVLLAQKASWLSAKLRMTGKAQEVLRGALGLSPAERADLAAALLDSLDDQEDEGVEEAWAQEIERRIAEGESGAVKMIPWSEARRRLRERLDAGRRS